MSIIYIFEVNLIFFYYRQEYYSYQTLIIYGNNDIEKNIILYVRYTIYEYIKPTLYTCHDALQRQLT